MLFFILIVLILIFFINCAILYEVYDLKDAIVLSYQNKRKNIVIEVNNDRRSPN